MTYSTRMIEWFGNGAAVDRPVTPNIPIDAVGLWLSNDTNVFSVWSGNAAAWTDLDLTSLGALSSEAIQDLVAALLTAGAGIVINYDDVTNLLEIECTITQYTDEMVRDVVGIALVAGAGITVTPNDAGDVIDIVCTITQYTDEMVRDVMSTASVGSTYLTVTPDDGLDTLTFTLNLEVLQDHLGTSFIVQGTGITCTYDDALNTLTIATTITQYTDEMVRDTVGTALTDSGLVVVAVNDGGDTIDIGVPAAVAADYRTGTDTTKALTADAIWDAAAFVTLNDSGGNIAVDMATGINFEMTMDGDYTLSNPTNVKPGQSGVIRLAQDGTGTQTLAYGTNWKFAGGTDPALSTAANSVDYLFYLAYSSTEIIASLNKAFA